MAEYRHGYITDTSGTSGTGAFVDPLTVDIYRFMEHAFTGMGGFFDGSYLVPHIRETEYDTRRQRAYYRNFFKPVVRAMLTPVFKEVPDRAIDGEQVNPETPFGVFIDDCDNRKHPLETVAEKTVQALRLHGIAFLVMDNFSREMQPQRYTEAVDGRILPYIYIRKRYQVRRYELDGFGRIENVVFNDAPVYVTDINGIRKPEKRFRGWDAEFLTVYKENEKGGLTALERIPHDLGAVPVLALYSHEDETGSDGVDPFVTHPPLYDLARMNWAIFQNDSWIETMKADQGCALLYAWGDAPRGGLEIGTKNAWYVGNDAAFAPGFIAPPAELLQALRGEVDALRGDFYRIAEQNGVSAVQDSASGIAKQWDFQAHGWVLARTAVIAGAVEKWCAGMFSRYTGAELDGYEATYKKDFAPQDDKNEIANLDMSLTMDLGEIGNREIRKRAAHIVLGKYVTSERMQEVQESIDAADFDKAQAGFDGLA